jgi:hypothetical protein
MKPREERTMRFMVMHKVTDAMEKDLPPDPAEMEAIGQLIGEAAGQGVFLGGEGLRPTSERIHIAYTGGKRFITDGPFAETKELVGGFDLLTVKSREEAIAWCDRFAATIGDVELFLGPVVEEWHLGFRPKPDDAPLRFLALHKIHADAEAEIPPTPEVLTKLLGLVDAGTKEGVLQASGGLASTRRGARIRLDVGKKPRVLDGPFAESKELVAGYAIFELPSKAAAIEWAIRFAEIVKVNEIDVREMC